jgi:hypothetical protein
MGAACCASERRACGRRAAAAAAATWQSTAQALRWARRAPARAVRGVVEAPWVPTPRSNGRGVLINMINKHEMSRIGKESQSLP